MPEAFVYLWYDAPNKMFYLGKHKGSPDDPYTHSSTIWEHFTKDNIPIGVHRWILKFGTHEEMCELEAELLRNRKERCWDKYYNKTVEPIGTIIKHDFIPPSGREMQVNGQFSYQKYHKLRRQNELPKHREQERKRQKRGKMRKVYGTDDERTIHGETDLEEFYQ